MTIHVSDKQLLALKKHAGTELRRLGINLEQFETHTLEWSDLNAKQRDIRKLSRSLIDKVKDDTPPEEARDIESAVDALSEAFDAIDAEKDIRSDLDNRAPRNHGGDPRRPIGEDRAVNIGGDRETADVVTGLCPEQRMADWARERGARAPEGVSLGRYLRSMVLGAGNDVEQRALSEGSDSAGGYTVPDILSANLIDLMRAQTVSIRAGARTVPLTSDTHYVAKLLTDPVPAWRSEAGTVAESDPTFGRITLTPRSLAVLVKVSRELLEDSLNISTALPSVIAAAMAVEVDRVALFGSGTAPQPRGVYNTSGIGAIAHSAALASYAPLVRARTQIKTANIDGPSAFIMHPRDEGTLAGLADTTGQPLMMPKALESTPMLTTTAVLTNLGTGTDESVILAGQFRHLLIGIRNQIRIEVLRERYADTLQYGFLAHLRMDVAVEHAAAFSKITGIAEPA